VIAVLLTATVAVLAETGQAAGQQEASKSWTMGEPIVTYWAGPLPIAEADAKMMAEGGFNVAWIDSYNRSNKDDYIKYVKQQLSLLNKYGLRAIVTPIHVDVCPAKKDEPFYLDDEQKVKEVNEFIDAIKDIPNLYGYHFADEPYRKDHFERIARATDHFYKKDPTRLVYVNLLPLAATNEQLDAEGNREEAYQKHLDMYLNAKYQNGKVQFLSYDHYNFFEKGQADSYFLNLSAIRKAALGKDIPFMSFVQASTWTANVAVPTCEQLRWLAYTQLAYGAQGIGWYVYGHPGHDGAFVYLNKGAGPTCRPTPLYYFVKEELNRDFVQIASALKPLKSVGVYHVGMLPPGTVELPRDNEFKIEPEIKCKPLPQINGASYVDDKNTWPLDFYKDPLQGFVVGCFGKDNKTTHALVVNLDCRTYFGGGHERGQVTWHKILGSGPLEVFDTKTGEWHDAGKEGVDLDLPPGGGILVRVKGL
jgi:hypothetical protein